MEEENSGRSAKKSDELTEVSWSEAVVLCQPDRSRRVDPYDPGEVEEIVDEDAKHRNFRDGDQWTFEAVE